MIVSDLNSALQPYLEATAQGQLFVLVDENTHAKCMPILATALADMPYVTITIPAGEEHKTLATVEQIWHALYEHHATREALLINLGGGMLTDLGGFAAATFMRGLRYVNIPTSLLAMVDASSGGKTGFNYLGVKNMIGCFAQPEQTLIYLPLLDTLPAEQWLSGYAEMLKHGLLDTDAHWNTLLALDVNDTKCSIPSALLADNLAVKERIVAADPTEKSLRKLLNFGHTVGHAIEEAYHADGRSIPHGYCVLWGMVAEVYLSVVKLGCPREVLQQLTQVMLQYYGRPQCNCKQREQLIQRMYHDKKNTANQTPNFTLLRGVGAPVINQHVSEADINEALEYLFREFTNRCHKPKLYKGYRLLAVDGSDLQFTANHNDPLSFFPGVNGQKPYSFLHLNALYDLNSNFYLDAVVQKRRAANENAALVSMVDRSEISGPVILTADRGYESYNTLEHIRKKGWHFLIRLRESKGIISSLPLPDGDFDMPVQLFLSRKQNKRLKELQKEYPGIYRFLPTNVNLDYFPWGSDGFYPVSFRIVRFKISDDSTETLITNLSEDAFPAEELKQLYHLRWGIETSFRQLKQTVGLRMFQAQKVEHIIQEIFARLIMYNFTELNVGAVMYL